jgi:hypothetical protein
MKNLKDLGFQKTALSPGLKALVKEKSIRLGQAARKKASGLAGENARYQNLVAEKHEKRVSNMIDIDETAAKRAKERKQAA